VPIAADSTNIVALRAENRALVAVVSELQGDLVVSQTSLETLKMTAIQLKTVDSVAYLAVTKLNKQLQQQLDSVQTTVKGAANVVRRRWYQRVWSVTKQTGTKIIIFGAGVGAGKVL
jgi:capsule polysaccharide export protein KpsE/RkpR